MNEQDPLLEIRFEGEAVGPGKVPVLHLLRFLSSLNKALQRVGRVLQGDAKSIRLGRPPRNIEGEVELDLVLLREGSPAAVLGFDRRKPDLSLPGMDFGEAVLNQTLDGLAAVQSNDMSEHLPPGYDSGVLKAWREAGTILGHGINKVEFTLRRRESKVRTCLTSDGVLQLQKRISDPEINVCTIEGRLLMADFKEHRTRCRVHPSAGEPILCLFDETQQDEVVENILRFVRIVGEATEDPNSGTVTNIKIHDIEPLGDRRERGTGQVEHRSAVSQSFWNSPSLEQLAQSQDVRPMTDLHALVGTWPGEADDGFEAAIDELRHPRTGASHQS